MSTACMYRSGDNFGRLGYLTEVSRLHSKHPYLPSHLLTLRSIFRLRKMKLKEGMVQT